MPTEEKRQAVTELAHLIRSSSAMAVADYRGLKVSEMQSVRRTLRDNGGARVFHHVTEMHTGGTGGFAGAAVQTLEHVVDE